MRSVGPARSCEKKFPKPFRPTTVLTDSTYQSINIDLLQLTKTVHGNVLIQDNSRVVPYNPFLGLKYNAHINVEVVHSVSAVKYLYKYITKGSDRVMMRLSNGQERDITDDEIERFVNAKYISASEAYWCIYDPEARTILYPDVYKHYWWERNSWVRCRANLTGCTPWTGPAAG